MSDVREITNNIKGTNVIHVTHFLTNPICHFLRPFQNENALVLAHFSLCVWFILFMDTLKPPNKRPSLHPRPHVGVFSHAFG